MKPVVRGGLPTEIVRVGACQEVGRPLEKLSAIATSSTIGGVHICLGIEVTTSVGRYDVTVRTNRNLLQVVNDGACK